MSFKCPSGQRMLNLYELHQSTTSLQIRWLNPTSGAFINLNAVMFVAVPENDVGSGPV